MNGLAGTNWDPELVPRAEQEELEVFGKHHALTNVPRSECYAATGKGQIETKWVDVKNSDETTQEYRSSHCPEPTKTLGTISVLALHPGNENAAIRVGYDVYGWKRAVKQEKATISVY